MIKYFYYYTRKYSITDTGLITRLEFNEIRKHKINGKIIKHNRLNKTKVLKQYIDRDGYANVNLYCNGYHRSYLVHHLVHIVYNMNITYITNNSVIDYENTFNQINHKDSNKLNNQPNNLELVCLQDNIKHSVENMTHNSQNKAIYIEIYRNGKYLDTVWKFKGVSKYLYKYLHKYVNTGTLCSYCKQEKDYKGFTFKYKV